MKRGLLMLWLGLAGCGSLIDTLPDAQSDGGSSQGGTLVCAAEDPCGCDPCTSTAQCLSTLQCVAAKHKGVTCSDGRMVCLGGP